MNKKQNFVRITTGITALALTCTLMTGCDYKKRDKFHYNYNIFTGEQYINKNEYISFEYIQNYYLIELYSSSTNRNSIYIANRLKYTNGTSKYTNIFTNNMIAYDDNEKDSYKFINVVPLLDYLIEYNLIKDKYTYDDMKEIYDIIKENYKYQENPIKTKKLTIITSKY